MKVPEETREVNVVRTKALMAGWAAPLDWDNIRYLGEPAPLLKPRRRRQRSTPTLSSRPSAGAGFRSRRQSDTRWSRS